MRGLPIMSALIKVLPRILQMYCCCILPDTNTGRRQWAATTMCWGRPRSRRAGCSVCGSVFTASLCVAGAGRALWGSAVGLL
ncbi:hypothetical protein AAFF_G00320810 [Aldrovandia affinis]|uniref:Secreted protein n=1 Tax=Aldrovandia affinis TaxID=143900 RepID=A0AAD7R731_9TELE|nr:hypothetical protein AAFF_G00320810 [Aldrovandia affinis]